mmetsp:Transcript_24612/g.57138  ORF Transcript_24612/g.57138 Transcript_24612/m.57138 type:complete len:117 (+) Transcript_24612:1478-1828(+)
MEVLPGLLRRRGVHRLDRRALPTTQVTPSLSRSLLGAEPVPRQARGWRHARCKECSTKTTSTMPGREGSSTHRQRPGRAYDLLIKIQKSRRGYWQLSACTAAELESTRLKSFTCER